MKRKKPDKPYWEMTTAELREATKEYDKEFSTEKTVPCPPEEFVRHLRLMRRLRRSGPSRRIKISMERGLLRQLDAYAKRFGLTRSAAIALAVQNLLTQAENQSPATS